jgi:hypothetical protein
MKKHYLLVHIHEPPAEEPKLLQAYLGLLRGEFHSSRMPTGPDTRPSENLWLLNREDGVSILARVVSAAERLKLKTTVQFLCDDI